MTITDNYILFYGHDWPSNFAQSTIVELDPFWSETIYDSNHPITTFKTAEAYYQSRKAVFANDKYSYYKIAIAKTPGETKRIAHKIKLDSKEWDKVKTKYMWETLTLKFSQNPELLEKLLDERLDDKKFVEASPTDTFWGVGKSEDAIVRLLEEKEWSDKEFDFETDLPVCMNMLGELLTKYRLNELQKKRMTK